MGFKARNIIIHLFISFGFLLMPLIFSPVPFEKEYLFNPMAFSIYSQYAILLLFFYINYYLSIPYLYFERQFFYFFVICLTFFTTFLIIPEVIQSIGLQPHFKSRKTDIIDLSESLFQYFVVFFVSLFLKTNNRWKQTYEEKINAELSYLKSQINPHFLFNTLNSIYSLAIVKSDYTPTAVVKLSGMMRYVISETKNQYVSLEKEISYISDYIELQKLRYEHTVTINYSVSGNTTGKMIAPIILIPFVENAFKHGVNPEEQSYIFINIEINKENILLRVKNSKVNIAKNPLSESGIGVENTKKRLQLIYPAKHSLAINDGEQEFSITLIIDFQ